MLPYNENQIDNLAKEQIEVSKAVTNMTKTIRAFLGVCWV